jgi:hypothetical protein
MFTLRTYRYTQFFTVITVYFPSLNIEYNFIFRIR